MKGLIYGIAIVNALWDGLMVLPNAFLWQQNHEWVSMAAIVIIATLGLSVLIAAPFVVRWIERV